MKKFLSICLGLFLSIHFVGASQTLFEPENKKSAISFDFADPSNLKDLKITATGTLGSWEAHEVQEGDIPAYQAWRSDATLMGDFGSGTPVAPADTETRIRGMWLPRFKGGQPHGALTLVDTKTKKPLGYVIAGGGR